MPKTKAQALASMVIDHLESTGDLNVLPDVIKALSQAARRMGAIDSAIVTTPTKLSQAELASITSYVQANYGKDYQVVEKIDPGLIAGITVRIGDEVIDASLATKLEIIRKELV